MTKGEAIDTILVRVSGGVLSDHLTVERADIPPYLSAVIDYVVKMDIDERKNFNLRLFRAQGGRMGSMTLDADLLCTYDVEVKRDNKRELQYVTLPVKIQSLLGNAGLNESGPIAGLEKYYKIGSRNELELDLVGDDTFYYYEKLSDENRVYYVNLDPIVKEVYVKLATSVTNLDEGAELPIPQGYEKLVIDMCVEFFVAQRREPVDYSNDGIDTAKVQG